MTAVKLRNLTKVYATGTQKAVDGLDLDIASGEFVALLGPSGCGKTTTLRMIAGLESATSGEVMLDGVDVSGDSVQERELSMVFQTYALFPHMTVAKNIGYGLHVARTPKDEVARRVHDVAKLVGIGDYLDRLPRQLSGGQRQRVALARALARESRLVLFDEPLSNLDAKLRDQTRAELKRIHRTLGNTMVYVTHDQLEAMTLSDRIAVMRDGLLQQFGSPQEVYSDPANMFVAEFIGSPSMNLLEGDISPSDGNDAMATLAGGATVRIVGGRNVDMPRGSVTVGFRPDKLELIPAEHGWEVDVVEPIGNQAIVHICSGELRARALVSYPEGVPPGSRVGAQVDRSAALYFDTSSGERLRLDPSLTP